MKTVAERVRQQVETMGANGGIFQFRQVRERLGLPPGGPDAKAAGNTFYDMKKSGVIEEVPGQNGRKRHKSFRLSATEPAGDQAHEVQTGRATHHGESPGHEIDVDLASGQTVLAWGHCWKVEDGHLTVYRKAGEEAVALATFAPGHWRSCVGDSVEVAQ